MITHYLRSQSYLLLVFLLTSLTLDSSRCFLQALRHLRCPKDLKPFTILTHQQKEKTSRRNDPPEHQYRQSPFRSVSSSHPPPLYHLVVWFVNGRGRFVRWLRRWSGVRDLEAMWTDGWSGADSLEYWYLGMGKWGWRLHYSEASRRIPIADFDCHDWAMSRVFHWIFSRVFRWVLFRVFMLIHLRFSLECSFKSLRVILLLGLLLGHEAEAAENALQEKAPGWTRWLQGWFANICDRSIKGASQGRHSLKNSA